MKTVSRMLGAGLAAILIAGCSQMTKQTSSTEPPSPQWKLIWSDEFDGDSINTAYWTHETFPGVDSGNNEFQHYTDSPANSYIEDGKLVIKALRQDYKDHDFTSARIKTAGKFAFKYGRVEGRIKIPSTKGIWPAFWMMPDKSVYGGWPHSGEIDILESVNIADEVYGTIHFGSPGHSHTGGGYKLPAPEGETRLFSEDFHVYAIEWDPEEIRWYVDGHHFSTKNRWMTVHAPYPAPFDQEFYLILNVAVGGNWPGPPDETSVFPQTMEVDWIRVYQTGSEYPTVKVEAPEENAILPANQPVNFRVYASDPDGEIKMVRLVKGSEIIDEATATPFELSTPPLADGCYDDYVVLAYDNDGLSARAENVFVVGEGCPQAPYGAEPIAIPGRIEAEHFDQGVEGEAYHDVSFGNSGGAAREDSDVDIGDSPAGVVSIGWTEPDEWLEYTVNVSQAGTYQVRASIASAGGGGQFTIGEAGKSSPVVINVPGTGDWHAFESVEAEGLLQLDAGETVLRLTIVEGGINIDSLEFERAE